MRDCMKFFCSDSLVVRYKTRSVGCEFLFRKTFRHFFTWKMNQKMHRNAHDAVWLFFSLWHDQKRWNSFSFEFAFASIETRCPTLLQLLFCLKHARMCFTFGKDWISCKEERKIDTNKLNCEHQQTSRNDVKWMFFSKIKT